MSYSNDFSRKTVCNPGQNSCYLYKSNSSPRTSHSFHSFLALSSKLSNVAVSVLQTFQSHFSQWRKQESKNTIIYIHHQAKGDKH